MKKFKLTSIAALTALMILSGCAGSKKTKVIFWTGFGGKINGVLEPLLAEYQARPENADIEIDYTTKGGYPNLYQAISLSVSNEEYPHIANGYPDHFATYLSSNILLSLDGFINSEVEGIGVDLSDFHQAYLKENQEMAYYRDPNTGVPDKTKPITVGLPFNKSTEIMIANQTFFDVMAIYDENVVIPKTWDQLDTVGTRIIELMTEKNIFGNVLLKDGTVVLKENVPTSEDANYDAFAENVAVDFRTVKKDIFRPISWDSTANFFITAVRQWGGTYTEMGSDISKGYVRFDSAETRAALTYFKESYQKRIFGLPSSFGTDQFASKAFKKGECVLTISSSAGADENVPDGSVEFPFRQSSNEIPYKFADKKYVISQGTNLALFDRGDAKVKTEAWKLLRYLTTEVNDRFGRDTSYFPVTKTMQDSEIYREFLDGDADEKGYTGRQRAIQDTAILNNDVYDDPTEAWLKFTDPGFEGSAFIRAEVGSIMDKLFIGGKTPDQVIAEAYSKLSKYVE
jgi:ABC-type glycerol-3-phosphate transport system substrate-binding protein